MSGDAGTWARAQPCADRNAKQVIVHMAAYADPDGFVWAKVSLLALEMEASERTVQRGIKAALGFGLLEETAQKKLHLGRLVPVYRMPMERGPANTRERIKAERAAAATGDNLSPVGCGQTSTGDPGDAPRGDTGDGRGVTPVSPVNLKDPREQFQENSQTGVRDDLDGVEVEAAFGRVWSAWSAVMPDGVARPDDWRAWIAAVEAMGDLAALEHSALRYLDRSPAVKGGRGKSLVKWLAQLGWLAWMAEPQAAASAPASFVAPAEVVAVLRTNRQKDWIAYLTGCAWDDAERVVLVRTRMAAAALSNHFAADFDRLGVQIIVRKRA
jgi:hypothetical protein